MFFCSRGCGTRSNKRWTKRRRIIILLIAEQLQNWKKLASVASIFTLCEHSMLLVMSSAWWAGSGKQIRIAHHDVWTLPHLLPITLAFRRQPSPCNWQHLQRITSPQQYFQNDPSFIVVFFFYINDKKQIAGVNFIWISFSVTSCLVHVRPQKMSISRQQICPHVQLQHLLQLNFLNFLRPFEPLNISYNTAALLQVWWCSSNKRSPQTCFSASARSQHCSGGLTLTQWKMYFWHCCKDRRVCVAALQLCKCVSWCN